MPSGRVPLRGLPFLAGASHSDVPLSIPLVQGIALDCPDAAANAESLALSCGPTIEAHVQETGVLLLRRTPLRDRATFQTFLDGLGYSVHGYEGGIAVRTREPGSVLVASTEDCRVTMAPHNEMAYLPNAPGKVFFLCVQAAESGGEVPINDIRETVSAIDERVLSRFEREGIRYHRYLPRHSTATQIGWEETFGLHARDMVDDLLRRVKGYEVTWLADEGLSYAYVFDAFKVDPRTGGNLWFNQVTELHCSYWRAHPLFPSDLPDERYPATTAWGSGEPIDVDLISRLRAALWRNAKAVAMRPGDVLVLDNTYIQHGRFAFTGPRAHFVSLTQ